MRPESRGLILFSLVVEIEILIELQHYTTKIKIIELFLGTTGTLSIIVYP